MNSSSKNYSIRKRQTATSSLKTILGRFKPPVKLRA
jgi:hypothetical protein